MSTKSITGTGLLLAVALLAQSLRLIFPFIPNQVSMFLIGSITSATFVLATWRYGWKNGLVIAWIAPVVAHLQGMLPLPPFILITALGTTAYVFVAHWLQHKPKSIAYHCGGFGKSRRTLWRVFLVLLLVPISTKDCKYHAFCS